MSKPFYVNFIVPDELVKEAYEILPIVVKTGKIGRGTVATTKAVERDQAKLVYIAEDVDPPEIVAHLPLLCNERKIPYIFVPRKKELGEYSGIGVQIASACIVDPGDAYERYERIIEKLKSIRKEK